MAKIEMYYAERCPFCAHAKALLTSKGLEFEIIDVMQDPYKRQEMKERADGRHTVPQIFINDEGIGGCDDLFALEEAGKLNEMLGIEA